MQYLPLMNCLMTSVCELNLRICSSGPIYLAHCSCEYEGLFCYSFQHITWACETEGKVGPWKKKSDYGEKLSLLWIKQEFWGFGEWKIITKNGFLAAEPPKTKYNKLQQQAQKKSIFTN
jgi:hypothetical protein